MAHMHSTQEENHVNAHAVNKSPGFEPRKKLSGLRGFTAMLLVNFSYYSRWIVGHSSAYLMKRTYLTAIFYHLTETGVHSYEYIDNFPRFECLNYLHFIPTVQSSPSVMVMMSGRPTAHFPIQRHVYGQLGYKVRASIL
ncbi:uncharacterized protein LOC118193247 [Stegodyphus dumicola]|uniref:uncharacterized protein LOC118193247 n=1 Tax=Stegodyphus dumicola TaxID=202533 RepID=UPI0015AC0131|nr:uncharacterized protein LOC118193247 [Stegodyphus dumicola]